MSDTYITLSLEEVDRIYYWGADLGQLLMEEERENEEIFDAAICAYGSRKYNVASVPARRRQIHSEKWFEEKRRAKTEFNEFIKRKIGGEKVMDKYHVVIIKGGLAVVERRVAPNLVDLIQGLAVEKYDYENEVTKMQGMFGNFLKCGGTIFSKCMVNREIYGNQREERIKNCTENCPREIPTPSEWLIAQDGVLIIVIDAQLGEVWRNDPCPYGSGKKYKQCCGR